MTWGRKNFELNSATVLRDLYRLLCITLGDSAVVAELKDAEDPLSALRLQFLEDELVHLLVSTAVANRIHAEHMHSLRADPDEISFPDFSHDCGLLQPDVPVGHEVALSFREACNKIVHADHITAETAGDSAIYPLPSMMILRGTLGKKAWIAHLSIPEYVRASTKNFDPTTL